MIRRGGFGCNEGESLPKHIQAWPTIFEAADSFFDWWFYIWPTVGADADDAAWAEAFQV